MLKRFLVKIYEKYRNIYIFGHLIGLDFRETVFMDEKISVISYFCVNFHSMNKAFDYFLNDLEFCNEISDFW